MRPNRTIFNDTYVRAEINDFAVHLS